MNALDHEVKGALKRIESKNKGLSAELRKAPGYAVFPTVGRAGAVLGGSYGHGEVFEHGEYIGKASIGQMTLGVQVGGETFSEIVIFHSQEALDRFKRGRIAFDANASAGLVKAASGTVDYEKDVTAKTYSQGGMLLELSLGVQGFSFKHKRMLEEEPSSDADEPERRDRPQREEEEEDRPGAESRE